MLDNVTSKAELLMGIKRAARRIPFNPKRDRFNLTYSIDTCIRKDLNANFIKVDGEIVSIATQYPYDHQVEGQLQLLVDSRTPALVVLASDKDISRDDLPEYFSKSSRYGEISVKSKLTDTIDLGDSIEARTYQLDISGYQATVSIPVIHVHNWPDHHTIKPESTLKLVNLIESISGHKKDFYIQRKSRAIYDPEKLVPVIHCRAGVGRTGQTIAAMMLHSKPHLNLATITKDLRVSRNDYMIQTLVQMETLVQLEEDA